MIKQNTPFVGYRISYFAMIGIEHVNSGGGDSGGG